MKIDNGTIKDIYDNMSEQIFTESENKLQSEINELLLNFYEDSTPPSMIEVVWDDKSLVGIYDGEGEEILHTENPDMIKAFEGLRNRVISLNSDRSDLLNFVQRAFTSTQTYAELDDLLMTVWPQGKNYLPSYLTDKIIYNHTKVDETIQLRDLVIDLSYRYQ